MHIKGEGNDLKNNWGDSREIQRRFFSPIRIIFQRHIHFLNKWPYDNQSINVNAWYLCGHK